MTKQVATTVAFLTLTITTICGQAYEPLDLAKKIFDKKRFPKINRYSTGEYKGRPNGKDLHKSSTTTFILLGQTEKTAVVAMTILDSLGSGLDTYLHFEKHDVWKMSAFRALAMTGILEQAKIELEKMTPEQVDSIISKSKTEKKENFSMFRSIEDYNFQLGNTKLTLELDDNIIKHFEKNKSAFEHLKDLALTQLRNEKVEEERSIRLIENLKEDYHKLFISSVSTRGCGPGNCINFLIGGMIDNTVGYLYVKDKKDLPEMNADRMIMLREIGNGWYIFKTT